MSVYHYVAKDGTGQDFRGDVRASSAREAAHFLREQGWFVLRLAQQKEKRGAAGFPSFLRPSRRKAVVMFCRQLALLYRAGIPLCTCMAFLQAQEKQDISRHVLAALHEDLQMGAGLAEAMEKHGDVFPKLVVQLVRAGESSGSLETVLGRLSDYLEASYQAREDLQTTMLYPIFLGVASLAAVLFILCFVLPSFAALFASMHAALPWPTRLLLACSSFLLDWAWPMAIGFAILLAGGWYVCRQERYRMRMDRYALRIPCFGTLYQNIQCMHIMGTLAILQESGMPIGASLSLVEGITGNRYIQQALSSLRREVQKGYPMAEILARYPDAFPKLAVDFLQVGEKTGELEVMLEKSAEFCRFAAQTQAKRLQALAEPCMILVLGAVVGTIVLSVAMPMLDSISSFG